MGHYSRNLLSEYEFYVFNYRLLCLFPILNGKFGTLIKSETFSGTADGTSNIHVSNNFNRLYIAAQANVSARILIPFRYNGNHTYIRILSNAGAAVPNTAISGVAWYIELN